MINLPLFFLNIFLASSLKVWPTVFVLRFTTSVHRKSGYLLVPRCGALKQTEVSGEQTLYGKCLTYQCTDAFNNHLSTTRVRVQGDCFKQEVRS